MSDEKWDGEDKRKMIRREGDEMVCPFHSILCAAQKQTDLDIKGFADIYVRKEDFKVLREEVQSKAPTKWVILLMGAPVLAVGIYLVVTFTLFSSVSHQIETISSKVSVIENSVTRLETTLDSHDRRDKGSSYPYPKSKP